MLFVAQISLYYQIKVLFVAQISLYYQIKELFVAQSCQNNRFSQDFSGLNPGSPVLMIVHVCVDE